MQFLDGFSPIAPIERIRIVTRHVIDGLGHFSMLPSETNLSLTEHHHHDAPLDVPLEPVVSLKP